MYTIVELVGRITKERETEIRTYITHYNSSYKLDRSDEQDILAILNSALNGKKDEAIHLFEQLETYPRETFAEIILNKQPNHMKLAINRINHVKIDGKMYQIDYSRTKDPEIGDLVVGRSDIQYDWQTMSLLIRYGKVIEIWENGKGIRKDGGFDCNLFMEEAFVLRELTSDIIIPDVIT